MGYESKKGFQKLGRADCGPSFCRWMGMDLYDDGVIMQGYKHMNKSTTRFYSEESVETVVDTQLAFNPTEDKDRPSGDEEDDVKEAGEDVKRGEGVDQGHGRLVGGLRERDEGRDEINGLHEVG